VRTPAQVDGWIGAASLALTPQDLDDTATAIQQTGRRRPDRPATAEPIPRLIARQVAMPSTSR
jgi:hypothetical protein